MVDASVVVEYLLKLEFSDDATRLFRAFALEGESGMWAPDLVYAETASAIRRLVREKALSRSAGERAVDQLLELPLEPVRLGRLTKPAFSLGDSVTIYDAVYVALAVELDAPLVTTDMRLRKSPLARRERIVTLREAVSGSIRR